LGGLTGNEREARNVRDTDSSSSERASAALLPEGTPPLVWLPTASAAQRLFAVITLDFELERSAMVTDYAD